MAEILVLDLCDCRPPLFIGGFLLPRGNTISGGVSHCFDGSSALFFPLLAIVFAAAAFLSPAQGLAL
jgi:hypothetical protein